MQGFFFAHMIISASRRTDIPALHTDWFFTCIRNNEVQVRNPFNPNQIKTVSLKPDDVDCFVFWTKNPEAMIGKMKLLYNYIYYFHFTLTSYNDNIETKLPDKSQLIATFKKLSEKIGPEKNIWRYDPIIISAQLTPAYHLDKFEEMCYHLNGSTTKCIISFVDFYKKAASKVKRINAFEPSNNEKEDLIFKMLITAKKYNIQLESCCEEELALLNGIKRSACINHEFIQKITGKTIPLSRDKNQRNECNCIKSIDIGFYNSCTNGCIYCYANK